MSNSKQTRQRETTRTRIGCICRAFGALGLGVASFALLPATMASAEGSSIGVFVDQPTTTLPPTPTTSAPATEPVATTTPPANETTPVTEAPVTTTPTTSTATTVPAPTPDTLPDVLPQPQTVEQASEDTGIIATSKKVASATRRVLADVFSGKPVADAIASVLPQSAADVVIPAVRTASAFAFPIGLAGAVMAFLGLQQRIDSGDPKLTAAPLAHDDDEVKFL